MNPISSRSRSWLPCQSSQSSAKNGILLKRALGRGLPGDVGFDFGGEVEQKQAQKNPQPGEREADVVAGADEDGVDGVAAGAPRRLRSSKQSDSIGSTAALRRSSR
jgi:hypothetical protein